MVLKLVSTEGGHAGLDASCSQGDKHQTHHGQSSEGGAQHTHGVNAYPYLCACYVCVASAFNSHVEGHVVGDAVLVCVRDVMDGADRHDDLSQRINDGQVNNSPVQRKRGRRERRVKQVYSRFREIR